MKDIKNNSLALKRFAKSMLMVICCVVVCAFNSIQISVDSEPGKGSTFTVILSKRNIL